MVAVASAHVLTAEVSVMLLTDETTIYDTDAPVCAYCWTLLSDDTTNDYCSAQCACHAARDNAEDRL